MSLVVEVGPDNTGIPNRTLRLFSGLITDLLGRAGYHDGIWVVRLAEQVKGTSHRKGLENINVRMAVSGHIELRAQPGDNTTSFRLFLATPSGSDPDTVRTQLVAVIVGANERKMGVPPRGLAKIKAGRVTMEAFCRLMNGKPFRLNKLTDEIATAIGMASSASLKAVLHKYAREWRYVERDKISGYFIFQQAFLEQVLPEVDLQGDEPAEQELSEAVAAVETPPALVLEEKVSTEAGDLTDEERALIAQLNACMGETLFAVLSLIRDGEATRIIELPPDTEDSVRHVVYRLLYGTMGLGEEEARSILAILESVGLANRVADQHDDSGQMIIEVDKDRIERVHSHLTVLASIANGDAIAPSSKVDVLEERMRVVVDRQLALAGLVNGLEAERSNLERQLTAAKAALNLLNSEVEDCRERLHAFNGRVVQEALAELKKNLTSAQLVALRNQLLE